jgi:segregation and condensation protein B
MSLKAKVEAIIYAAEEPVTLEQISLLLKDIVLADLASAQENAAIEQADSAAEAEATASAATVTENAASDAAVEESALLPELALDSAEPISPEPGPLMPDHSATIAEPESTAENASNAVAHEDVARENVTHGEALTREPSTENLELAVEGVHEPQESTPEATPAEETPGAEAPVAAIEEPVPAESASVNAPETTSRKRQPKKTEQEIAQDKAVRARIRGILVELVTDYANEDRGMEIRQVAGGFRMATKPEHHDVVRAFAKSLKPPIRLSLAALETLAVIAYKQPITGPEIADIRGVESASVLGTLLDRKLITTAGRKQVIGRPMQYKTSKDFLLRFGLNDVNELPSMEEFSQLASDGTIEIAPSEPQESQSLFEPEAKGRSDAEGAAPNAEVVVDTTPERSPEETPTANQLAAKLDEAAPQDEAETEPAQESQEAVPDDAESNNLEAHDQGLQIPESQEQDAAEVADSQPQSEAESSNVPETEHPIGQ